MKVVPEELNPQSQLFDDNSRWFKVCLILLFLLGALIRQDDIQAPGFAPTREYTSAIIARGFYSMDNDKIVTWRRDIATMLKDQQPILEPPLTEYLVSFIYRITGKAELWYARYLTSIFWLIGGIFIYKMTKILLSSDAALFATAYYLLVPMGIIVSRSFQPEPLMIMMYLISLYSIVVYFEAPNNKHLFFSATLTGITILIRPLVLFSLLCSFIAISIYKKRSLARIIDRSFLTFIGISLFIPFIYYGYGILIADFMRWKVAHSFRPHLFAHWEYWRDWFYSGMDAAGHLAVILAILGFAILRKEPARALVKGLSIGYIIFGLVFNYHIMTHSYYQAQLFPLIGISASPFLVRIGIVLKNTATRYSWVAVVLVLLYGLYSSYREVRESWYRPVFESPKVAREIGKIIEHNPHVVTVAYQYGLPLAYYGEFSGTWWLKKIEAPLYRDPNDRELSVQERLDLLGFQPEYFVITNMNLFNRNHKDLGLFLNEKCNVFAQTDDYLIYSNCQTSFPK